EVVHETGVAAPALVLVHPVTGDGDAREAVLLPQLPHQIETGAVGEPQVRENEVEGAVPRRVEGIADRRRRDDLARDLLEEESRGLQGVAVVLDEQDAAAPARAVAL